MCKIPLRTKFGLLNIILLLIVPETGHWILALLQELVLDNIAQIQPSENTRMSADHTVMRTFTSANQDIDFL
ncbi:hypothetical protein Y1Q_0019766 [Alligator mississippiensis]|uniref:Uncharacterized protein n=1 Tax=Alligator mississippiensis TaxID=8496 RepID=A0A151PFA9_ALLMI|nr:hypothetical protein Y1Q_0019766 [Alligator mississippiensis]